MSENPADPYHWFDPEWMRVETMTFGDDGAVTRSSGWVRREDWFRNDDSPTTEGES